MRKLILSVVQMSCSADKKSNVEKAAEFVRESARIGANAVLLPELFERPYFCQERNYEYFSYADEVNGNEAIKALLPLSKEFGLAIPVSFYERCANVTYNSVEVLACGKKLGVYRKTHIPDDHYYQEKFYFAPGDSGFKTFKTQIGTVGVGICWDQWFPETARCLALNGAEVIMFPTAIGSEPILGVNSSAHWRRVMCGHAAANLMPVAAANRVGVERVEPTAANGGQSSELTFYGSSFIADGTGEVIASLGSEEEGIATAEFDLDALRQARLEWGLFRDRRPSTYKDIVKK